MKLVIVISESYFDEFFVLVFAVDSIEPLHRFCDCLCLNSLGFYLHSYVFSVVEQDLLVEQSFSHPLWQFREEFAL